MAKTIALVVAAGRGRRFGAELPKQYIAVAGRPLLYHSAAAFARHPRVDAVRVVIHPDDRARYDAAVSGLGLLDPV
ncbi:MAG: 2-C-methyl-D-erythritol 4-phosphate cytidylyltransferase, partial [Proteobacteria bacterium]|nr:2-C-methyl-D-erythritol 4-phosphate cytidylyltransferase [Pseudomonadota bacterium]